MVSAGVVCDIRLLREVALVPIMPLKAHPELGSLGIRHRRWRGGCKDTADREQAEADETSAVTRAAIAPHGIDSDKPHDLHPSRRCVPASSPQRVANEQRAIALEHPPHLESRRRWKLESA